MTSVLFLTTAETDLLTLSSVLENGDANVDVTARNLLELDNPVGCIRECLDEVDLVLLRVVGGAEYLEGSLESLAEDLAASETEMVAVTASGTRDETLQQVSTYGFDLVDSVNEALHQGGPKNYENVFDELTNANPGPVEVHRPPLVAGDGNSDPDLVLLYYRANALAGDRSFVDAIRDSFGERGLTVEPVSVPGITRDDAMQTLTEKYLRDENGDPAVKGVVSLLGFARSASGDVPPLLESLDVPWFQLVAASRTEAKWARSSEGLDPSDLSMKVIFPELDGRLNGPPVAFKSEPERVDRIRTRVRRTTGSAAGIRRAARWIKGWLELASKPNPEKNVAIVLGNHPTSRARIGNGVGLDTPASLINLLEALKQAGYRTGSLPEDDQAFMDYLVEKGSYTRDGRTPESPAGFVRPGQYRDWLDELAEDVRTELRDHWDDPSTSDRFRAGFSIPGVRMQNVFVGVQPPRGFEERSEAVYHDPDLTPPHLYVAFYRWMTRVFDADAVVHLGKHGTLEWLPGRSVALGESDWPALLLEECPLLYPFIINDPGEGTQAKRRTGAVIVDHMVAPQRETDCPGHLEALDGALADHDVEAVRTQLDDQGLGSDRDLDSLDEQALFELARDRLKDVGDSPTRSGLHVLGELPEGKKKIDLLESLWPETDDLPSRNTLKNLLEQTDRVEGEEQRILLGDMRSVEDEIKNLLHGLNGKYVNPGPSGAPTEGRPDLLPTGRNFYSRDARGMPSRSAWKTGCQLAGELVNRYRNRHNKYPTAVGLVLWGTANMRTGGEDVAQVLSLMGVRPVWTQSGRVDGVEVIPERDLDRPRIDPLVRVSGFFRDAFPNLVQLIQEGVQRAGEADVERYPNFLAENNRRAGSVFPRVFSSRPGNYGAGLLPLIETADWNDREDLAEAFLEWGQYAYDGDLEAEQRRDLLEERLGDLDVVTQNRDNREHDLYDSDDYFQFHGGMFAASDVHSKDAPDAYVSDTSSNDVTVRTLAEESERVFHSRVRHPVWQEGMRDHGYKGAFEMAATVDYVFGYDATTQCVPDTFYEQLAEDFILDETNRSFLEDHNQHALRDIGERLIEAADRDLWENPSGGTKDAIESVLRDSESGRESNAGHVEV